MRVPCTAKRSNQSIQRKSVQFSSDAQSYPTLCDPTDCSMPGFPVHHQLLELAQTHVHRDRAVTISSLCHPFLLLPSIFPSIRVFSNELALRIRWPKYWGFSFSISPSSDYSELISFRIDWFDLLGDHGKAFILHIEKEKNLCPHNSCCFSTLQIIQCCGPGEAWF